MKRIVFSACLASAFLLPAAAQDLGSLKEMGIADGGITKAKAEAVLKARFNAMDTNHDGKLSQDEYVNAAMARLFAMDSDGDGTITRAELRAALREHFRR